MSSYYQTLPTPIGTLTLVETAGALSHILFEQKAHLLPHAQQKNTPLLQKTSAQLQEYFDGHRTQFDLPLNPTGSEFSQKAWNALCQIPYGQTLSYEGQAEKLGGKQYTRAVGRANNVNPLPIVIPCHRVIGKNGSLVGYAGGTDVKSFLLKLEQPKTAL